MIPQAQREMSVSSLEAVPEWSPLTRIGFRFAFSYFLLYAGAGVVGSLGSYKKFKTVDARLLDKIWHPLVNWVGVHIFHLTGSLTEVPNGSGDELYDYVLIPCLVAIAILATIIWSSLDRNRRSYCKLYAWLRLFMRLLVGWAMLGYGVKKLIGAQFTPPTLAKLLESIGRQTPMGMLWTFMGSSQAYSFFGGFGETLGGVLLIIPGITALGALVSLAMMSNVLMLNLCYDVPRKIFSIHLVLMCLFLLLPEVRRLTNVFILNRTAYPVSETPLFRDKLMNRVAVVFQIAFGAYVLLIAGQQSFRDRHDLLLTLPAQIRGVWAVQGFVVDGIPELPNVTGSERWQHVIFDRPDLLTIQSMDGEQTDFLMRIDEGLKTAELRKSEDPLWKAKFTLEYPRQNRVLLQGQFGSHKVTANLERKNISDPDQFPLANRSFHWVDPAIDSR